MDTEMRKRLEEAAEGYALTYKAPLQKTAYRSFEAGAEWMFKECGGMTVLHDMRRLILAQCKAWLKWNAQPKYIYIEGEGMFIDNAKLLADFEEAMNKLWEEKK